MDESERLQRYRREKQLLLADENDECLAYRIAALLNHPKIDEFCMVDAFYYDYSIIPDEIQKKFNFSHDVYIIFGITTDGEIISKWIDRYDLDNFYPVIDGKVIKPENKEILPIQKIIPELMSKCYDPNLLSKPIPDFIKMFGRGIVNEEN